MDTNETERALVPVRRHGAPWVDWRPEVQSAGADTIEFSFDVGVSDAMWEALERERETAQLLMKERRCVHVPEWLNVEMHPTGARGGYRCLLETPDFTVKIQKGLKNRPPIYVEMRAFGLHTHEGGELAAVEDACKFIRRAMNGTLSVSGLARLYPMSTTAVQKHVAVLEEAELVHLTRHGRQQFVQTEIDAVAKAQILLVEFERLWRDRLDRIGDVLAEPVGGDRS